MKATELMIGDWCKMKLSFGTTWFTDKVGCINPNNGMEYEPIPLTPEILGKNGFVSIDNGCKCVRKWNIGEYTYADMSVDCDVEVDMLNGTSSFLHIRVPQIGILGMPLYYVHTLQHALRLCGLNDLADNFKV